MRLLPPRNRVRLSARQTATLLALADEQAHTLVEVARRTDTTVRCAAHTLDALYRRSLVSLTPHGRWFLTGRGARQVAA